MNYSAFWIYNTSQICSGCPIILGGDHFTFYFVHILGIILILVSFCSCSAVFRSIYKDYKKQLSEGGEGLQLSSRFPFFIAVTDAIWCVCHICDHLFILWYKTCPEQWAIDMFAVMMTMGIGYQQFLQASLALGMYFKICHNYTINLGYFEWKIHLFIMVTCSVISVTSINTGAYGCSGFWIMNNLHTQSGNMLAALCCLLGGSLCFVASASYVSIKKKVEHREKQVNSIRKSTIHNGGYHQTASNCLVTFLAIAILFHAPLSLAYLFFLIQTAYFRIVETTTILAIIILANSLGTANAFSYFYTKRIRDKRRFQNRFQNSSRIHRGGITCSPSSCNLQRFSSTNSTTSQDTVSSIDEHNIKK